MINNVKYQYVHRNNNVNLFLLFRINYLDMLLLLFYCKLRHMRITNFVFFNAVEHSIGLIEFY